MLREEASGLVNGAISCVQGLTQGRIRDVDTVADDMLELEKELGAEIEAGRVRLAARRAELAGAAAALAEATAEVEMHVAGEESLDDAVADHVAMQEGALDVSVARSEERASSVELEGRVLPEQRSPGGQRPYSRPRVGL